MADLGSKERPADAAMAELGSVIDVYRKNHPQGDVGPLGRAYDIAHGLHAGQFRMSGEPYITHPLAVAEILASYGMDATTLSAALLHDTVEDTEYTIEEVEADFGPDVARLIDGVTKLEVVKYSSKEEAQAASIRKMVVAMAQDVRVLLIKLADRLHNLRTIAPLAAEKQQRIARETIEVYAPLAHRLGVQEIKHEMEDRCFAILHPGRQAEIEEGIERRAPQREAYLEKVMVEVSGMVSDAGIEANVTGRPKHIYSIYRKMVQSGLTFEEIHDLIGIRILVDDVQDCYAVLGLIHSMWPPIHGRFKDYIAMPKFNLYQSIHTTVIGPEGKPLEVQIRSHDMHERAEFGIAAHWRYKEGDADHLPWMADVRFLHEAYADPTEFLANLKLDLYQDEVFVLTPAGDVMSLPKGATPVDFAYSIHTDVGHRCQGARVNGRLVQLDTELSSGDIVEIITSKAQESRPSRDWLAFVRTGRAKAKIKHFFSKERRETALASGREEIMEGLRREGLGLGAAERDRLLTEIGADLGLKDLESLFISVGEHGASAASVVSRIQRKLQPAEEDSDDLLSPIRERSQTPITGIIVEGLDDVWVRIARCCAPVPGDDIVGFVTVGRGVSVHRSECTNTAGFDTQRMIEVMWAPDRVGRFSVWLQVEALDRSGLLRDVSASIADHGGNIVASSSATGRDRVARLRYEVELSDPSQVDRLLQQLRTVAGVYEAFRVIPGAAR